MKAPQYQVGGSSTPLGAFIWDVLKPPSGGTTNFGFSIKNFPMTSHFYDDISTFENARFTPPAKRLIKTQNIRLPSKLGN